MTDEHDLRVTVSKGQLKPVYLLVGNDQYLTKRYANMIAKKTVPENTDLNLFVMKENCSLEDIYDRLFQFSFTGERICVLASNFDFESCNKDTFKALQEMVESAPDQNVLVLYYDVLAINTKKSSRFKSLAKSVEQGGGMVCELNHKSEGELVKMLCDGAAKRLRLLEPATAKYMISVCSTDLNILINELEKLCDFADDKAPIDREMVDKICVKTVEASVYDMSRYILAGKAEQAYYLLDSLLASGISPAEIHALITSSYVDIFRVKAALEAGKKADSIAADFGYPQNRTFVLTNAARDGKGLNEKQISAILKELLDSDASVKSDLKISGSGAKTALETLITKILKITAGGSR